MTIELVCLTCKRMISYGREIDPSIPANVVRIEQQHCDLCWDGDREDETWFDSHGIEVPQTTEEARLDIVKRLRAPYVVDEHCHLMHEAADEIERLRQMYAALHRAIVAAIESANN